jgi:predicted Zn-ribbon and HTH transcriptional regulator
LKDKCQGACLSCLSGFLQKGDREKEEKELERKRKRDMIMNSLREKDRTVGKAGAYLSKEPIRCSTIGFTYEYQTMLERLSSGQTL